jgi:hypothetical protein
MEVSYESPLEVFCCPAIIHPVPFVLEQFEYELIFVLVERAAVDGGPVTSAPAKFACPWVRFSWAVVEFYMVAVDCEIFLCKS